MATEGTIRVHVRHQIKISLLSKARSSRDHRSCDAFSSPSADHSAICSPGCCWAISQIFALRLRTADAQQLNQAALDTLTVAENSAPASRCAASINRAMALTAVEGLEIRREPDLSMLRLDVPNLSAPLQNGWAPETSRASCVEITAAC